MSNQICVRIKSSDIEKKVKSQLFESETHDCSYNERDIKHKNLKNNIYRISVNIVKS